MMYSEIRGMLAGILGQDEAQIASGAKLWRSVDVVSLSRLLIACERRYRITIDDEHAPDFRRLNDLVDYVHRKVDEGRDDYVLPDDRGRDAWYYE